MWDCTQVKVNNYSSEVLGTIRLSLNSWLTHEFLPVILGGDISISGEIIIFDPDQLTLTCISTGGPATTVTWTRYSTTVTQGNETVLNDPVNATYTHTLTVTTAGDYMCTVSNEKPSSASASITLEGNVL